jgi:hypothetical protein
MESEQILNAYPDSKNRKLLIAISFREMPCANAIKFLDTASRLVLNAGFDLTYSIVNV